MESRFQYRILILLNGQDANSNTSGCTVVEIKDILEEEGCNVSKMTLFRNIKYLYAKGLVEKGVKDLRADTYYITEKGMEEIKNA